MRGWDDISEIWRSTIPLFLVKFAVPSVLHPGIKFEPNFLPQGYKLISIGRKARQEK